MELSACVGALSAGFDSTDCSADQLLRAAGFFAAASTAAFFAAASTAAFFAAYLCLQQQKLCDICVVCEAGSNV